MKYEVAQTLDKARKTDSKEDGKAKVPGEGVPLAEIYVFELADECCRSVAADFHRFFPLRLVLQKIENLVSFRFTQS